jgi:type I restriction enzyme S subunit
MTVPPSWEKRRLEDLVLEIQSGFAQRPARLASGIGQIRTHNISPHGDVDLEDLKYVEVDKIDISRFILRKGDVLFNNTNSEKWVGKSAIFDIYGNYVFSNHITRIRTISKLLDPLYLSQYLHYLWSIGWFKRLAKRWVNQAAVDQDALVSLELPCPPLPEQRQIAAVLHRAAELRRSRHESMRKAEQLLPALFLEMFGNSSNWRHPDKLGGLVRFVGGGTPSRAVPEYFTGTIPWATSKDVKSRYLDDAQEHITEKAIGESATNPVPARTILMVVKSKILAHSLPMTITTRPFCFGQDLKGLVCNPGIEPEFIVAAVQAQREAILRQARGVNTEGLTLEILREIPLPSASSDDQQMFMSRVALFNQFDRDQQASKTQLDLLVQALTEEAFIGDLTTTWREAHASELIATAAQDQMSAIQVSPPPDPDELELIFHQVADIFFIPIEPLVPSFTVLDRLRLLASPTVDLPSMQLSDAALRLVARLPVDSVIEVLGGAASITDLVGSFRKSVGEAVDRLGDSARLHLGQIAAPASEALERIQAFADAIATLDVSRLDPQRAEIKELGERLEGYRAALTLVMEAAQIAADWSAARDLDERGLDRNESRFDALTALSEEQLRIYKLIRDQPQRYVTPERLHEEHGESLDATRRALQLLSAVGLVVESALPVSDWSGGPSLVPVWRLPRKSELQIPQRLVPTSDRSA